jgi:hypothetical protein
MSDAIRETPSRKAWDTLPLMSMDFAWPYWGMLRDTKAAISSGSNYMAMLCLLVYTEVIGRSILGLRRGAGARNPGNEESFYCFYEGHMGQKRSAGEKIYEHFRHGAAHTYGFLATKQSIVAMRGDGDWLPPDKGTVTIGLADGQQIQVDSSQGAVQINNGQIKLFVTNIYFRDFQRGLVNAAREFPQRFLADPSRVKGE